MRAVSKAWLAVLMLAAACGGSVAHSETAKPVKPAAPAPAPETATAPPDAAPQPGMPATAAAPADALVPVPAAEHPPAPPPPPGDAALVAGSQTTAPAAPGAPERLEGGEIPRATLLAVLSHGIGRFLQKVRAEAHLVAGRFLGWRLLALFENDPAVRVGVLQPGDTVLRVNGQSIERPEQFKNVWDSMATESELVLLVQRAGKRTEVRYRIVDSR
jgi:hypothetical protein